MSIENYPYETDTSRSHTLVPLSNGVNLKEVPMNCDMLIISTLNIYLTKYNSLLTDLNILVGTSLLVEIPRPGLILRLSP